MQLLAQSQAVWIPIYVSMGGLLVLVYTTFTGVAQRRRERKNQAQADADIVEGRDKTAIQHMQTDVTMLVELMKGREPSWQEPHPPAGLVAIVNQHTQLLNELLPNGGNSNSTGDLILRMGERMGVTVDEEEKEE